MVSSVNQILSVARTVRPRAWRKISPTSKSSKTRPVQPSLMAIIAFLELSQQKSDHFFAPPPCNCLRIKTYFTQNSVGLLAQLGNLVHHSFHILHGDRRKQRRQRAHRRIH